jgi:uncharacterized protein
MTTGRKISITAILIAAGLVVVALVRLRRDEKAGELIGMAEPLNTAIYAGDIKTIQTLIAEDKRIIRAIGVKSSTPLNAAVNVGRMDIVELLVTNGAPINNGPDDVSALHCAVGGGNRAMIDYFLSRGANVNAKAMGGVTPLHMAVNLGKSNVVALLVSKGADLNAKSTTPNFAGPPSDFQLFTPRQWALRIGEKDIAEFLRKSGAKE